MTESSYTYYDGTALRSKEEGVSEEANAAKVLDAKLINLGFETKEVPYSKETFMTHGDTHEHENESI